MHVNLDSLEAARDRYGVVLASVVNKNDCVYQTLVANFGVSLPKRARGVISGHDDDDFFISIHTYLDDWVSNKASQLSKKDAGNPSI